MEDENLLETYYSKDTQGGEARITQPRAPSHVRLSCKEGRTCREQLLESVAHFGTCSDSIVVCLDVEVLGELLDAARRREFDVCIGGWIAAAVRCRSGRHTERTRRTGFGFVSITEALDLTTPPGRAMAGLLAGFAEFEHEVLRERVRAGLRD